MTDTLLALSQNPVARRLIERAKLPIPMPEQLERLKGPMPERALEDKRVVYASVGAPSALTSVLARTLTRSGAKPS